MDIRFVDQQDKADIKKMWQYCFGDRDPFLSWYFDVKYLASNTLAVYENGTPVSSVQLLPYTLHFYGNVIDISYVVGVATLPEARGKGYVTALMQKSIEIMYERGHLFGILLPFQYDFYRKYGWDTCYYHKLYEIKTADLKPLAMRWGNLRPLDIYRDIENLMDVYKRFNANKHGYIVRTDKHWKAILDDLSFDGKSGYLLEDKHGIAQGYILYGIAEGKLDIFEMGYTNSNAYKGLLWFVYSHAAQAEQIVWRAPADDMTHVYMQDPKHNVSLKPFVMARAVDVHTVLSIITDSIDRIPELTIKVIDIFASRNDGIFIVKKGKVAKGEGLEPDISCTVGVLTQMSMGFITPDQAYRAGLLQVKSGQTIDKASMFFKMQNNFINDYY